MYPYDQYYATTNPQRPEQWQLDFSAGRIGVGLATTALEALQLVQNGRPVPLVTFDPWKPIR